jgi:hypothetical protein
MTKRGTKNNACGKALGVSYLVVPSEEACDGFGCKYCEKIYALHHPNLILSSEYLLRVGWRNFFSSCAVVSVFQFWREIDFGVTFVLRVQYSCGIVLVFWFRREIVFGVTTTSRGFGQNVGLPTVV